MDSYERDKLYDWLERGRVDIWLRRMMKERLEELEAALPPGHPLLKYKRPEPLGSDEAAGAMEFLRTIWEGVRIMQPRLDNIPAGSLVILQTDYSPGWTPEVVMFLGISGESDDRTAKFIQLDSAGKPYEWEAYRYAGRWAYGTSADSLRVVDVAEGITSCPADGHFQFWTRWTP